MTSLDIALSLMTTSQRALDLVGQNIANATTPGYHRQTVLLSPRVLGGQVGQGVEISQVRRMYDSWLERSLTANLSRTARIDSELNVHRRLDALYAPGQGTLSDRTEQLFNGLAALTVRPDDVAQRRVLLNTAVGLTSELNGLAKSLSQVRNDLHQQIDDSVNKLNQDAEQLAKLNQQIEALERAGRIPNDLLDQRDQLLNEIAGRIDVRVIEQPYGVLNVIAGNAALVVGAASTRLETAVDSAGVLSVQAENTGVPLKLSEGSLAGLLNAHNEILLEKEPALDEFARQLASRLDAIQATGLGLGGPQTQALGSRAVDSPTTPLASAGTAFPVQAGSLFLSVTDQTTGQRTLHEIAVDPATQSLQDLAAAITTGSGGAVQATVTTDGRLQLQAQANTAFDFAGRIPSSPTNVVMNGTAIPSISGTYTGSVNGTYSVQVVGSGTVGVTPNLRLEARDANNNLVVTVNVGAGYVPGTPVSIGNGLTVRLGAGTTSAGSFTIPVVAQADTSGALTALGVGTLFQGAAALDLQVRPEVLGDPTLLAGSRDGQPGDGSNFARMERVRDLRVLAGGRETLQENLASQASTIGAAVQAREDQQAALRSLGLSLQAQQQSISGVDPNEEALSLMQYQRAFQMATRYVAVINTTLDDLINIVR